MQFVDLGRMSFSHALQRQDEAVAAIAAGEMEETVHLVEHPHTFTVGRAGDAGNLLARQDWEGNPIDLVRISRGGDITYHGPGQLVGYPHLDLRRRGRDVHRYLRDLEEALINAVAALGIDGYRRQGYTGVWTDEGKLASIGVGVRRWVTFHGFALNVSTDLRYFELMNPCGLPDCPMASLTHLLSNPTTAETKSSTDTPTQTKGPSSIHAQTKGPAETQAQSNRSEAFPLDKAKELIKQSLLQVFSPTAEEVRAR